MIDWYQVCWVQIPISFCRNFSFQFFALSSSASNVELVFQNELLLESVKTVNLILMYLNIYNKPTFKLQFSEKLCFVKSANIRNGKKSIFPHINGLSDGLNETRILNEFAICFLTQNSLSKDISHNMDENCGKIDKCRFISTCTSLLTDVLNVRLLEPCLQPVQSTAYTLF